MRDVERERLRWMLRRVAMGLAVSPLALIAACSSDGGGGGGVPFCMTERSVQSVRASQISPMTNLFDDCRSFCRTTSPGYMGMVTCAVRTDGFPTDAPADGGGPADAGAPEADPVVAMISCEVEVCRPAGRRPALAMGVAMKQSEGVASWLREVAELEAASIDAFAELRDELSAHAAPRALVDATVRAEADEVLHARLVGQLASRAGARPVRPEVLRTEPRGLFALAQHNASEGCVREAYGALAALHQAHNASSPEVRAGFLRIAQDEARHALLSLALDDWMRSKLSARQVRALEEERALAVEALADQVGAEDALTRAVLGLPDAERGRDLVYFTA